jgi:signal transduction histidine kinase
MNNDNPLEGVVVQSSGRRIRQDMQDPARKSIETIAALLDPEWLDLNALIIDVMARLLPLVRHHKLRWQLARVLPLLWGDRNKLAHVFFCLIGNAMRYSPAESEIYITTAVEGRVVHVRVCDQGANGVISELEYLLQRYRRDRVLDHPHDRLLDDGLPLVYAIIRMHAGRVWIESGLHEGFIFHFTLPFPAIH